MPPSSLHSDLVTADIRRFCVERMREAYDPGTGLFSKQLRSRRWGRTEGTEEITSTAICLIGASRAGIPPEELGVDPPAAVGRTLDHCVSRYPGGLGLAVWMNAAWNGEPLADVLAARRPAADAALLGVPAMTTMEVSWLLCGLAHERARTGDPGTGALLDRVRSEALSRYLRRTRLFRHSGPASPLRDRIRRNVANFADQIYSVMGFAFDAIARSDRDSASVAAGCMDRLIELRGELGQWWWHYHPPSGGVSGHYPVYAVHQHGMAPIALTAVSRSGGGDRSDAIRKSFAWLSRNELDAPIVDREAGTLWRDVAPRRAGVPTLVRHAGMILGWRESDRPEPALLALNHETRPYEWGWCLYFGSLGEPPASGFHLV